MPDDSDSTLVCPAGYANLPRRALNLIPTIEQAVSDNVSDSLPIDAYLMLGLASRESDFGAALDSDLRGDKGNGLGIWQIDRRYHADWAIRLISGKPIWYDPYECCKQAISVLSQNYAILDDVNGMICAYNADLEKVKSVLSTTAGVDDASKIQALDQLTTGKNYVSDVLRRMNTYKA